MLYTESNEICWYLLLEDKETFLAIWQINIYLLDHVRKKLYMKIELVSAVRDNGIF